MVNEDPPPSLDDTDEFDRPTFMPVPPVRKVSARMTVVESIYLQANGEQPSLRQLGFSRTMESSQPVQTMSGIASENWISIFNRNEPVGQMAIQNLELPGSPSLRVGVVRDGQTIAFAVVRPGETMRLEPFLPGRFVVQSLSNLSLVRFSVHSFLE